MSGTTMIVLIVFISVGFGVLNEMYQRHLAFKRQNLKANEQQKAIESEIANLKARVATLEQIVTDEGYQLNKDINKL